MGFENLVNDKASRNVNKQGAERFRQYPYHEYEDKVLEWIDEHQDKFPEEIQCDFVEISPNITEYGGWASYRERNGENYQYIRFGEQYVEETPDWQLKLDTLHEMLHLYFFQKGYVKNKKGYVGDSTPVFRWVAGRLGAPINDYTVGGDMWEDVMVEFYED